MRPGAAWILLVAALLAGCNSRRDGAWEPAGTARATARAPGERDLFPQGRASSCASGAVTGIGGGVPLGALLIAAVALAWTQRRRARVERAVDGRTPLSDGPQRVAGVVEPDPGAPGPPLVVHIHQRAREIRGKNGYSHTWKEVSRDVLARPFQIRRDDGLLVRVQPDARTVLQADLSLGQRHTRDSRTRSAELRAGARVHVAGQLVGAHRPHPEAVYRERPGAPVLVAPPGGRLLISAEPPGDTASRRARLHTGWAVALATVMAILGGAALNDYLVLLVDGSPFSAAATATKRWTEWVKPKNSSGRWVPHYGVRARATVGGEVVTVEDECGAAVYDCVRSGACPRLPFVISTHLPGVHRIGSEPGLHTGILALLIVVSLILLIAYPLSAAATRPWYLRSKVVDTKTGRLDAG